jgi:DNA-binding response OmpR family regulator
MLICLIDDDSEDAELFCEALKDVNRDTECIRFHKIPAALEYLETVVDAPSIIFLDAHLPSGNTMTFLAQIRSLSHLNSAKVFIYSGFVTDAEKEEYTSMGATDVITKPNNFNQLRSLLKNLLSAQSGA